MTPQTKFIGNLKVSFLGGKDGVGGNLILLEYRGSKIILDLGIQFSKLTKFYTWPLRVPSSTEELIDLGIAPKIDELYAVWDEKHELNMDRQRETDIDGAFISHYHLDHCYLLPQINRRIPVYMGETSKIFFEYYKKIKRREKRGIWRPDKLDQCIRTFRTGQRIEAGEFTVYPIHVEHSLPGAYGFIVECKDGFVAYTGDYRLHGPKSQLTRDFIEKCREMKLDLLITEGTNFFDVMSLTEEKVLNQLKEVMARVKGAILASFGLRDVDRFNSYFKAAEETGKDMLMSYRQLLILHYLKRRDPKLRKSIPDLRGDMVTAYYKSIKKEFEEELRQGGFNLMCVREKINGELLKNKVVTSFTDILQEISLVNIPAETVAIFSESEPVDEESEIELEKITNWLQHISVPSYRIHCSGHIYPWELRNAVKEIKPKDLEVVHSDYPETLKSFILKD